MNYTSILISGRPGSGKTTLAERLSKLYGWQVHSVGQLFRDRWRVSHPDGKITFEAFWRDLPLSEKQAVNVEMRTLAKQGSIIGDTRYVFPCRDLASLSLFVTAPLDVRAQRALHLQTYSGKSYGEIQRILQDREADELRIGQQLFGYDYRDLLQYALVLDTSLHTVDEEVALVQRLFAQGKKDTAERISFQRG